MTNERKRRRVRRAAAGGVIGVAVLLGFLLRGCFGLGGGDGAGVGRDEPQPESRTAIDARAADAKPTPCKLLLNREGLTIDGRAGEVEDAVRACTPARKAHLRATGDALTGTYDALIRALGAAEIQITEDRL